ncbi:MAG: SUMF1/EgtB/PvdO family nonheme iron enzyme [Pontiellaceae bacterium]|nr:SUMF1/EgtB/PvdO family nonheme iron enzyme [Pontiellaceae bacterium]MBN2783925.1 SUMF1/EgtB/PvdO family nonheme iron enzyme [Pontiellaceae bacterium]
MNKKATSVIMAVVLCAGASIADLRYGISMDFTSIGDAGNAADSTGYGAVGYSYRISTMEVSLGQFLAAVGAGDGDEDEWSAQGSTGAASMVSFLEAAKFCNYMTSGDVTVGAYTISESGGQVTGVMSHDGLAIEALVSTYGQVYVMPTEDEWYKAAYYSGGDAYSLYANGTSTLPVKGVDANYGSVASAWTVDSGAVEQNGTYNMMGNVWEWTESAADGSLGLPVGEQIAFRGGAYNNVGTFLASGQRASDYNTLEHQAVGVRVVAIPEPAVAGLISLAGISALAIRRIFC